MSSAIMVLGGDGFCGWPTALRLCASGYDVTIVDNLSRRRIDLELECSSLTPIRPVSQRLTRWKELTGKDLRYVDLDIARDYDALHRLIAEIRPKSVVHFAEQRAAPYSMKSSKHKRYTVDNNINGTHNLLCAIVECGLDVHLVHLGTMGVYGYSSLGVPLPEGYLKARVDVAPSKQVELEMLYPAQPGSVYHTTKTLDALLFYFYNKNDGLRITDLHQGIVWGTQTRETGMHVDLINRFDYDGDYGTVLNRFLMQAAIGHPLTVYGTGRQTRAFIHINDTVNCIQLAIENPPAKGQRVDIFNQATETHTLLNLATQIAELTNAEVRFYENPRNEQPGNELILENRRFLELGLRPTTLAEGLMTEIIDIATAYKHRCDLSKIISDSVWTRRQRIDKVGKEFAAADEPAVDGRGAARLYGVH